jgi:hypothetical protein
MALVTFRRIAEGPIEKVLDHPIEFLLLIEFNCGIRQTPSAEMID